MSGQVATQVHIGHGQQYLGQQTVAHHHGTPQRRAVHQIVAKQSLQVLFGWLTLRRGLDGSENVAQHHVQILLHTHHVRSVGCTLFGCNQVVALLRFIVVRCVAYLRAAHPRIAELLHHVAEELCGEDKVALLLYHHLASLLGLAVGKQGIVKVFKTRIVLQLVDVEADALGDIAVKEGAQYITLEGPAIHGSAQVVGNAPNGGVQLLALFVFAHGAIDFGVQQWIG